MNKTAVDGLCTCLTDAKQQIEQLEAEKKKLLDENYQLWSRIEDGVDQDG